MVSIISANDECRSSKYTSLEWSVGVIVKKIAIREYCRSQSVVFLKTNEAYGGLSNMAGGYALNIDGVRVLTSEALYQACRFPHMPNIQKLIISQTSPMTAKMRSKPYRDQSREDWLKVRVRIMQWCLRVKLVQNWATFSELLLSTGDLPIVECSRKDTFWGAVPVDGENLFGANVLGRLLMELRKEVIEKGFNGFETVTPPDVEDFYFLGKPISDVPILHPAKASSPTKQSDMML
ncbi:NADAR family protein [Stutzerimonas stutzeri]